MLKLNIGCGNDIKNNGFNLEATGKKEFDIGKNWENIKITSWGNRVGIGKPFVTLKELMDKKNEN